MIELLKLTSGEEIICIRVERNDEKLFTLIRPYRVREGVVAGRFISGAVTSANREIPFPRSGVFFMVDEKNIKQSVREAYLLLLKIEKDLHG